jgi:hypothetical protein
MWRILEWTVQERVKGAAEGGAGADAGNGHPVHEQRHGKSPVHQ